MDTGIWKNGREAHDALAEQLSALRGELKSLRKQARRHGADTYDDARDLASEVAEALRFGLSEGRHAASQGARRAGRMVRKNPGTVAAAATVGLLVTGLLASMLLSRRD